MTHADFMALLPILILSYGAVILMLAVAFWRRHSLAFGFTVFCLIASFASLFPALKFAPVTVSGLLLTDRFSLFFTGLMVVDAFLIALLSKDYLEAHSEEVTAYYILLIFAVAGMAAVVSSAHFISFFLGLETLSVSLYGLIGYTRGYRLSLEGAIKYLVMAATASAFLLFGIALVYSETGTMEIARLAVMSAGGGVSTTTLLGIALILVVFGFKLAIVPFHMWSPDVYQGAPAPVTALIATGSKGALLAFLLRLVVTIHPHAGHSIYLVAVVLSMATMSVGNLLALRQTNVKRLLAYSSIAHMGYLLIPLIAGGPMGASSIAFYLISYFATTLAAFGIVAVISSTQTMGDVEELSEYRGLGSSHPLLAGIFALAMISLTGIPPTAGFMAKFYIFTAAAHSGLWALLIVGVLNSGISAFYYLRVLVAIYSSPEEEAELIPSARPLPSMALCFVAAVILFFGFYPAPLIRLAEFVTR